MGLRKPSAVILCTALALCAAVQAGFATVVVVDPNNMGTWVAFKKDVEAAEPKTEYAFADMAPGHSTIGVGAFYARTGVGGITSGQAPGQIWLGNDQYSGTRLADITKLEYTTYTYTSGAAPSPSGTDYVRQPIQLQLVIQLTPGGEYGYLMHRPWGMTGQGHLLSDFEVWQTWDALSSNHQWYLAYSEDSVGDCGTWSDILLAHPNAVLATPPGAATNWDVPFTGTGYSLNFEVGAKEVECHRLLSEPLQQLVQGVRGLQGLRGQVHDRSDRQYGPR